MRSIMRTAFLVSAIAGMSYIATPGSVAAEQTCGERDEFVQKLSQSYGERPSSVGLESKGRILEIFRSDKGSWTILATQASGISCIVAVGESWIEGDWKPTDTTDDRTL